MVSGASDPRNPSLSVMALVPFFLITFGLSWGILALFIFLPQPMTTIFGALTGQHPLFFLAVYAPAIAAFILVTRKGGLAGLKRFLARFLLWRTSFGWYGFLLVGIPLVFYAGAAVQGRPLTGALSFDSPGALSTAILLMAVKGPVEEFGWRGLALPLLQRKLAPLWAALILGVIWGLWHLPAFLLSGTPQGDWSFAPFFLGAVAISVIVTPMFNASAGSILLPAVFHFQLINPVWPEAQPYDTVFLLAVAVLVVWVHRKEMLCRDAAVTEVIPDARGAEALRSLG
ncbi:type II CAAX endopeptidase family protein [Thiocapsa bogorovii]|uniref:type II CAAX endopeptidase family protein n=1 Tax=Thiocapsa bogorovii TaxID=521689 RepID=UPI001E5D5F89|nr:type II CAAX endopeptidase family protein [Thiocapsa bogorovii]UHD17455.1 CPBP family intramembrane metalloprotease [Thiocapsa bogorovii]